MLKRIQPHLLIMLAFACGALWSNNQVWADAPCETVREYVLDETTGTKLKVEFDRGTCEVVGVSFLSGDSWVAAMPESGEICVCTVNADAPTGTVCTDDYRTNETNTYVTAECHPIKAAGPRSSGCPIWSPAVYLSPSGDVYVRGR